MSRSRANLTSWPLELHRCKVASQDHADGGGGSWAGQVAG